MRFGPDASRRNRLGGSAGGTVPRSDLVTGFTTRDDFGSVSAVEPGYSKTALGSSITFESYLSSGVVEVPEMDLPAHIITTLCGQPDNAERF